MEPKRWARVRAAGAHGLRRGAWYPVVNDTKPTIVFLDVNKRNVAVDRSLLEFADARPARWSIVVRSPNQPVARRAGVGSFRLVYAVCPQCRTRADVADQAPSAACPVCGGEFEVDWQQTC